MTTFPAARYQRAGATPEQLAELEQTFVTLSDEAQQSLVDHLAGVSDYEIADGLATAAAADAVDEPEPETDAVDEPETPAPAAQKAAKRKPDPK